MLRTDLDPAPALTSAQGTGVGFAVEGARRAGHGRPRRQHRWAKGGADTGIPLDSVERMKAALAQGSDAARRSQVIVYPHAQHAFHADYRPNYDEAAARDGWQRCLDWMRANGLA